MPRVPNSPPIPNPPKRICPPKRKLYRGMAAILRDASKSSENLSQGKTRNLSKIPVRSKSNNPTSGEDSGPDNLRGIEEANYDLMSFDTMFTSESSSDEESPSQRDDIPSAQPRPDVRDTEAGENSQSRIVISQPRVLIEPCTAPTNTCTTPSTPKLQKRPDNDYLLETNISTQADIFEEVKKLTQASQLVAHQMSQLNDLDQRVSDAIDKTLDHKLQARVENTISATLKEINTSPSQVSHMVKEAVATEFEKGMNDTYFEKVNEKLLGQIKNGITNPMAEKIHQIDVSLENTKVDLINVEKDLKQKYINNATSIVQVNNEIKKHKEDIKTLTNEVKSLKESDAHTTPEVEKQKIEAMLDDLEQRTKAQNIFLTGPAVPQETTEVIPTLNDLLKLSLSTNDVVQIIPIKGKRQVTDKHKEAPEQNQNKDKNPTTERHSEAPEQGQSNPTQPSTSGKHKQAKQQPPPEPLSYKIIFTDVATQRKVMRQKTQLQGKKMWLNADLTKKRYEIFREATKLKKDGQLARVWADNGKVLCKVKEDSPVTQFRLQDFQDVN